MDNRCSGGLTGKRPLMPADRSMSTSSHHHLTYEGSGQIDRKIQRNVLSVKASISLVNGEYAE